ARRGRVGALVEPACRPCHRPAVWTEHTGERLRRPRPGRPPETFAGSRTGWSLTGVRPDGSWKPPLGARALLLRFTFHDPIVQARSRENKSQQVFVDPVKFLVTGPGGSTLGQ